MNTPTASPVNTLLARLFQEPELLMQLRANPDAVFAAARLTAEECAALRDGSFGALARIGVHPTLRMHYQMAVKPEIGEHVTVRDFLPALQQERRHG